MTDPRWERVLQEWRQSRRLRLAILVVGLILGLHLILMLSDHRRSVAEDYGRQADMLARLQDASREAAWPARAAQAEQALAAERATIPAVRSAGLAQAELQAWLNAQGAAAQLQAGRALAETTLEVPGHPGLWQVIARLDAEVPPGGLEPLLVAVSGGLPWIQVQQLDVADGTPMRVSMILRGYYRRDDGDSGREGPAAGPMDSSAPAPVGAPPPVTAAGEAQVPTP